MSNMRQKDLRPAPALIEFKGMKFLITDRSKGNFSKSNFLQKILHYYGASSLQNVALLQSNYRLLQSNYSALLQNKFL